MSKNTSRPLGWAVLVVLIGLVSILPLSSGQRIAVSFVTILVFVLSEAGGYRSKRTSSPQKNPARVDTAVDSPPTNQAKIASLGTAFSPYLEQVRQKSEIAKASATTSPAPPGSQLKTQPTQSTKPSRLENTSDSAFSLRLYSERFHTHNYASSTAEASFTLPTPPKGVGAARWLPAGESIQIAGTTIPGGMIYVGSRLAPVNSWQSGNDPCLITQAAVASTGSYTERQTNYWPSYSEISPQARRAYLNWLATGRSDPDCDIGYVFLFFYGLERRIIVDNADSEVIAEELRRLLSIYAGNNSFRRYAGELLNWIELRGPSDKLYLQRIPKLNRTYELPMYLRLALGQTAADRVPVPCELALTWVRLDPQINLRTPAIRCEEEFSRVFTRYYTMKFGQGIVLPKNRTKLKFSYTPASSGLRGAEIQVKNFGDVPDITAITGPLKKLQALVDQCTDELTPFSRAVGKDPSARERLDGLLLLPVEFWPHEFGERLRNLASTTQGEHITFQLHELLSLMGGASCNLTKEFVQKIVRLLAHFHIGMEPSTLSGAKTPTANEPVVLFGSPDFSLDEIPSPAYQTAVLTLQLASAVAISDGSFSSMEEEHLVAEINQWTHLTEAHRNRLKAHLRWLRLVPISLASLKKKLEPLETQAKEVIATLMATLAQADGVVSPAEVKFLEKVYKALGVDPKRVFSDVHEASARGTTPSSPSTGTGFKLDESRIAALQADTAKVTELLASIFTEDELPPPPPPPIIEEQEETSTLAAVLGLDEEHSALARLLFSRQKWARGELEDAAADLELMLDGALERINEAAFDAHDMPLTEGDDPVEINIELVEKIEA